MSKPKIFITQPIEESALKRLQAVMDVEVHPDATQPISKEDLIRGVRNKDFLFCRLHDTIGGEALEANPNLKLIATMATSPGQIDMKTATRLKIPVTGRVVPVEGVTRDSIIEETADMAWTLLMAVARRLVEGDAMVRSGVTFPGCQSLYLVGSQVHGKTLGIVGMGKIGRAMARRAKGFNMKVLFCKRTRDPETEREFGAVQTSLEDLLRQSDFVSLHAAYSPETHHLIGAKELDMMKPTAFLINTARGQIVDQDALIDALRGKKIGGAGLDVYRGEPQPNLPGDFLKMKNVVLTPHLGSAVAEKREIMANTVADIFLDFLSGKEPKRVFNPEVLAHPNPSQV